MKGDNSMKRCVLTVMALIVASVTAQARLGETADQIAKRYGKPTLGLYTVEYVYRDYGDAQAWYGKDDIKILVVFKDGTSQYESVVKKDTTATLSHSEVKAFLDANLGGSTWSSPKETPTATIWSREDGGARASITADRKTLTVMITQGGKKGF
jgi:hypothetical protein